MSTIEKITQPSRRFTDEELEVEEKKSEKISFYVFPNHRKELVKHGIPVSPDMQDTELTRFMKLVDAEENIEKKVATMVRLRHTNRIDPNKGKKVEYLVWYENWKGFDSNGHRIPPVSDLPQGYDKHQLFSKMTDNDGKVSYKPEGEPYFYYFTPYSPEAVDKILEDTETDPEEVQYTVKSIGAGWSGFSYEEFKNLDWEELNERGRNGTVQGRVSKESDEVKQKRKANK